jgi:hypothetical protein
MTTPDKDGWITNGGKRRPVHRDEVVNVKFRGSGPSKIAVTAGDLDWVHRGDSADITHYRVVTP